MVEMGWRACYLGGNLRGQLRGRSLRGLEFKRLLFWFGVGPGRETEKRDD